MPPDDVSLREYIERILEERDKALKVALDAQRENSTAHRHMIGLIVVALLGILAGIVAIFTRR